MVTTNLYRALKQSTVLPPKAKYVEDGTVVSKFSSKYNVEEPGVRAKKFDSLESARVYLEECFFDTDSGWVPVLQ